MSNVTNTQGLDQTSNDAFVQGKVNEGTKSDGGRLATDTGADADSNTGAVGSTSNSLVDDLIAQGPESDSLHNMAAQSEPQKSDVTAGKTTDAGNPSGNNDVSDTNPAGGNTKVTNQDGNINADLNHGPGRQGRV